MRKHEIKVGQVLYHNTKIAIRERKVTKVGSKYFYCDNDSKQPFNKESLQYTSEYTMHNIQLYLSKQDLADKNEYDKLMGKIRMFFGQYKPLNLTLGQLRAIDIITSSE